MKLADFFNKLPLTFVTECLDALPGADRKRLLNAFNCRVKMGPGALQRQGRNEAEARRLYKSLADSDDVEDKRSLFQGWLARRAPLIIAILDAWEVTHNGGFVEDFDWAAQLSIEKVKAGMESVREKLQAEYPEAVTPQSFMVYFAYLELACLEELFNIDAVFAGQAA